MATEPAVNAGVGGCEFSEHKGLGLHPWAWQCVRWAKKEPPMQCAGEIIEYDPVTESRPKGYVKTIAGVPVSSPNRGLAEQFDPSSLGAAGSSNYLPKTSYEGNATRSQLPERFDLVPFEGVRVAARRFAYGAARHGDRNWESGGKEFALATVNHLVKHVLQFAQTRQQEDLDALVCNGMMLAELKRKGLI